jgi:hypothetical protein
VSVLSRQLSRNTPADAGFLSDKAALRGPAIKEKPCIILTEPSINSATML